MGGSQDGILVRTQSRVKGILCRNLFLFAGILCFCVRTLQTALFDFVDRNMYDVGGGDGQSTREFNKVSDEVVVAPVQEQVDSGVSNDSVLEEEKSLDTVEGKEEGLKPDRDQSEEKENSPKFLSFRFPSLADYSKTSSDGDKGNKPGEGVDETWSIDSVVEFESSSESPMIEMVEDVIKISEKESLLSESDTDSMSCSHSFSKEKELSEFSAEEDDDTEFKDCKGRETTWDVEEDSKLESLWEHQGLIEQIKMELEKARRVTGLPTIPEDSESPKIMEDLKQWKMDDRSQHEETMGELHRVHKSYRERMRKFDILNYQKMCALGFLQSKNSVECTSALKPSSEGIASLLSQTFKMCRDDKKHRRGDDPMAMFIRELHCDLETVYVGQMCLSWEFLHWQYMKALDLWESDQDNSRRYNEVAGEFQQFQVVLQRFLENERFEGSRVQCYVRNRHFLRNLVQIPAIKEDGSKDRRIARLKVKGEYVVTSDKLVEILEESIRTFWRFVRSDKDSSHAFQKGQRRSKLELQNSKDSELLAQVQTALEKKEKKLKEILKGRNCILRKFQKHEDDDSSDQVLYFFSQVEMMLIRRVLNMSRPTTDQISWCHGKLSSISFARWKIHVEPSFSLFPC